MQVRLDVSGNKSKVKRITLHADAVVGRSQDCNLRIASNQVSREHCRIIVTDTAVLVRDLGSSNGTFVNGEPITPHQDVPISSGAQIAVGPVRFVARFEIPKSSALAGGSTAEIPVVSEAALAEAASLSGGDGDASGGFVFPEPVVDQVDSSEEPVAENQPVVSADMETHTTGFPPASSTAPDEDTEPTEFQLEAVVDTTPEDQHADNQQSDDAEFGQGEFEEPEDDDEEPPPQKRGKLRSLFGFMRRKPDGNKKEADEVEVEDEQFDDQESVDAEETLSEAAAFAEETTREKTPAANAENELPTALPNEPNSDEPAPSETTEDDVTSFLMDAEFPDNQPDAEASGDDDELDDFLNQLGGG